MSDPGWKNSTVLTGDPVEQGGGRRLFPDDAAFPRLALVESPKAFTSGVTLLRYGAT